ncbi:MAG: hypothetical protein IPG18_00370 [Saprospiraceae bacterium]|nr:hypothetical protein [Saprospiraceae bacterium]MBK6783222.1 hypothetical protein [Saprospiraceae bacterium]MBK7525511.1 hypothetical protein [Saprospiraceae bacterium]MBK8080574.1 hypothetical protein [Saprospiraceae bacterium]MBK8372930.1 hypothetical protein [Saprospiraceae bacterium]
MSEKSILGIGSRVKHPAFGDGVVISADVAAYRVCFITFGIKLVGKEYQNWDIIEKIEATEAVSFNEAEKSLIKILKTWSDISEVVPLGDKWKNGVMILKPEDASLKPKEVPIDAFFHKIVMVRDRVRVMEQRINSSDLNDEEKVNLQQYITRIYGSLTTFNVLFKNKEDYFVGEKSNE